MEITVLRQVQAANNATADDTRRLLAERGICMLNVMGGAGSGKTALLERLLPRLAGELRCAVLEGDLATTRDAERIAALDIPVVQLQTDGCCHLDAWLVFAGLQKLPLDRLDLVVVENVGNLVCPAEFDIGEHARLAVLSLMEGDDKPAKYPDMFAAARLMVITKVDLLPHVDFDVPRCMELARRVNPRLEVLLLSARSGQGLDAWLDWLLQADAAALAA